MDMSFGATATTCPKRLRGGDADRAAPALFIECGYSANTWASRAPLFLTLPQTVPVLSNETSKYLLLIITSQWASLNRTYTFRSKKYSSIAIIPLSFPNLSLSKPALNSLMRSSRSKVSLTASPAHSCSPPLLAKISGV